MSSCCPICYRAAGKGKRDTRRSRAGFGGVKEGEVEVTEQRFFRLLERYLSNGEDKANEHGGSGGKEDNLDDIDSIPLGQLIGRMGLHSCGECLERMEGFCQSYHQLKLIELELNCKVERLRNVMKGADGVPSKVNYFRKALGKISGEGKGPRMDAQELTELVEKSKKGLIEMCSRKVLNSFPKLSIVKWRDQDGGGALQEGEQVMRSDPKTPPGRKRAKGARRKRKVPTTDSDNDELSPVVAAKQPCLDSDRDANECHPPPMDEEPVDNDQGELYPSEKFPNESAEILSQSTKGVPPKIPVADTFELEDSHPELPYQQSKLPELKTAPSEQVREGKSSNSINSTIKSTKTSPGRASRLRSTHKCTHCQKTFSSEERLQSHVQQDHEDDGANGQLEEGQGPLATDKEGGNLNLTYSDDHGSNNSNSDNMICELAPEEAFGIIYESSAQQGIAGEAKDTLKIQTKEEVSRSSIKKKSAEKEDAKGTPPGFRLKCPHCDHLFESVNELLLHRKDSMSCGASYDPTATVRVEVFIPPPSSAEVENGGKMGDSQFTNRLAVIDLPQAIFTCDVCKTIAYSLPDLEAHEKLHCNFPCDSCDEVITFAPEIPLHDLRHSESSHSGIQCPCCDFKCASGQGGMKTYVHHYLKHHLSLTWNEPNCPICNTNPVVNKSEFEFGEHCKRYHDLTNATTAPESVKRCTVTNCKAYFLTTFQLQLHLKKRHGILPATEKEKKHKCQDCDKWFGANKELLTHRLKCHVDSGEAIPCVFETCPKVFESKEDMHRHIIGNRTVHQPLDDPTKEVQCPKCEASFSGSDPNLLVRHLKSQHHNKDPSRKFVCGFCGKSFRDNNNLQVHSLLHSGPASWKFVCNVCSKKFPTKQRLENHMRKHTKEKPFECEVCGKKLSSRYGLKLHLKSQHGGKGEDAPAGKKPNNGEGKVTPKRKNRKKKIGLEEA